MNVTSYIVRILCMASLVCLAVGPVALLYICPRLFYTESIYQKSICDIVNLTKFNNPCHCMGSKGTYSGIQRCVVVDVKFELETVLLRNKPPKSKVEKDRVSKEEMDDVNDLDLDDDDEEDEDTEEENREDFYYDSDKYTSCQCLCNSTTTDSTTSIEVLPGVMNSTSQNITCYINPNDKSYALWKVDEKRTPLTVLVWPLVLIGSGVLLAVIAYILSKSGQD